MKEQNNLEWALTWLEGRSVSLTEDEIRELLEVVRAENEAQSAWERARVRSDKARARILKNALDRTA
jgi:hypothetical protein